MCVANEKSDTDDVRSTNNFTWKVLLEWATTSDCNPFPGTLADDHKGTNSFLYICTYIRNGSKWIVIIFFLL